MKKLFCLTHGRKLHILLTILSMMGAVSMTTRAQTADDDIWREVSLKEVNYKQSRNYCQRLYGYYRFIDDGIIYFKNREHKLYRVYEGIYELDIRYSKEEDDGAKVLVGRDLIHPDKPSKFVDFYELKPYTFLEKARKLPKYYTIETNGDTTRVFTKGRQAGIVAKDRARKELRMKYDALAPDTSMTINLLIIKARLSNVQADALYWYDNESEDYVPQGQLKRISFDGNIDMTALGTHDIYVEHTELYVDSVAYFTYDEYKTDKKNRRKQNKYTDADIDKMKQKLGVPPLSAEVLQRIEEQRDWDEDFELWKETHLDEKKKDNQPTK
ncbi:MAG: hypothetical protein IKZ48_02960 [Prevotella sp.]|nr:hypothetical protein [Prevotella sp.]